MTASPNARQRLSRRSFLLVGSAATAAAVSSRLGLAAPRAFSAGYVLNSADDPSLAGDAILGAAPRVVVPATTIAPETALAGQTVRLQVRGLFAGPDPAVARAFFDVLYPASRGRETYPYLAWTYTAGCLAQRVTFDVPVGASSFPELRITTRTAQGLAELLQNVLSLEAKSNGPRLRRGTYLLGLRSGQWTAQTAVDPARADPAHLSLVVSIS